MKNYSKKERQTRKLIRNICLALVVVIGITVILSVAIPKNEPTYTAEELLHDHDGDGIPDH